MHHFQQAADVGAQAVTDKDLEVLNVLSLSDTEDKGSMHVYTALACEITLSMHIDSLSHPFLKVADFSNDSFLVVFS